MRRTGGVATWVAGPGAPVARPMSHPAILIKEGRWARRKASLLAALS